MKLTVIGCSGSFPGPYSPASCYLLQTEHEGRVWSIVLDLGNGSLGVLQRHVDPTALDAVILSHLHADHFLDMCGLYVMAKYQPGPRERTPIRVIGPADTPQRVGLAYYGHPTEQVPEFDFDPVVDGSRFQVGPFAVSARRVNHPVEAYGYRVEANGRVVTFTGDTDTCQALLPLMHGADLVLADTAFVDGRDPERDIHMTGSRVAQAALDAGHVKRLMLTHIPAWNDVEVCRAQAAAVWPGAVEVATPELVVQL
ncbi:MAG TPA: MBL fold metallo-hydrolase [Dermatophilaceae bacterium]|jgi:ribonuclease BN (tRNA processing enzyme)|nr:MBL fold metallo-hydrolase [Actinomycetales bacterium]HMT88516.1 MBL fold metallo-hydrolase [Dermatophilaceae bacterium]